MKFGRVLVTTALVAVLASSLFSGWLASSLSPLKPPIAQADNGNPIPDATTPPTTHTQEEVKKWMDALTSGQKDLRIIVPSDQSKPNPPYIAPNGTPGNNFIPADPTSGRPALFFKLAATSFNHASISSDTKWLIFQGYELDKNGENPQAVSNLYFMVNDGSLLSTRTNPSYAYIIYDTDQTSVYRGIFDDRDSNVTLLDSHSGGLNISDSDINNIFGYVMDVPKGNRSDNCQDPSGYYKTGPPGPDVEGATTKEIYDKHPDVVTTNANGTASNLNANCGTEGGWLKYWGVNINFASIDKSGCGLTSIVSGGIGGILIKIIACIFQTITDGVGNFIDGNNTNSPLYSVACISYVPPNFVGVAHAQGEKVDCSASKVTGAVGSLETELSLTGGKDSAGNALQESPIHKIWKVSMGVVNIVVVLALLAIAFANILHLNINTYAAKKALPALIIGVVGANASWLLARFMVDVTGAVSIWAADIGTHGGGITSLIIWDFPTAIGRALLPLTETVIATVIAGTLLAGPLPLVIALIVALIAFLYYVFLIIAFMIALFKRIVILYFLIMVAPIAFVAYGIPSFQKYFTMWWDNFIRQLFVFPIILFGMAATVILADAVGTGNLANPVYAFTAPGFVTIVLILAAGTLVLKLPKLVTKGALDVGAAFKKAIGAAPRIAQGAQSLHGFAYGGGYERLKGNLAELRSKGNGRLANALRRGKTQDELKQVAKNARESARLKLLNYGKEGSSTEASVKNLKKFRGFSTLFGNPEILQKAYQERVERDKKMDFIAAVTKTGRIPGMVRGAAAEAEVAKKLALDELKDARTPAEVREWRDGLGKGHLDAVYNKKDASMNLWERIKKVTKDNPRKMEMLRQKFGSIGNEDDMIKFIEKDYDDSDPLSGGLGIGNQWNIHDLMKASGYESTITKLARSSRLYNEERGDAYDVAVNKRPQVDPEGRDTPGGGAAPSGGPSNPAGGGGGGTPAPSGGPKGGGNGGSVQNVRVVNPVTISNPQNEALAGQLAQSAERIMSKFSAEELNAHASNAKDIGDLLSGEIGDALKSEFSSFIGSGGGADLIKHAIGAYASGGGLEGIRQKIATGEMIQQTNQNLAGQAAGFSDEQLEKLGEKISSGNAEALKEISGVLAPHIEQLSKAAGIMADPNLQTKYAQRIIDGFRQVMTQGPKSMRSYLQTNFSEFANAFANEQNIDHITPESIAKAIAKAGGDNPPPSPGGGGAAAPQPSSPPAPTQSETPTPPEPPPTAS